MDDRLLDIFQSELKIQCEFVLLGAAQVNAAGPAQQGLQVWFALQGILVSAANSSKLLWGSREEEILETRRLLRESVEVSDDSPLNSRRLRNDFEHFDERLETWFDRSKDHNYVGRNIGPVSMIELGEGVPTDQFGHFDPLTSIVTFWERSRSLNDIVEEAHRIATILEDRG